MMTLLFILFWVILGVSVGFVLGALIATAGALREREEMLERLRWMQRQGSVVRIDEDRPA